MYIWIVEFEELWSNYGEFEEGNQWRVVAKDYDKALEKARKVATSKDRDYKDDDGTLVSIVDVRLVSIKRGATVDA